MSEPYRTSPVPTKTMPGGIPFIIGNEAAERFSFYGMKALLTVFMTKYLIDSSGQLDVMGDEDAKFWYHVFTSAVYFTPIFGALLSDYLLGKYKTILLLSIVYCFGHLALALDETRLGLMIGLTLIAIGAGGIKPCVSAHVGDQFGPTNQHLLGKVFGWFYFAINLGAMTSMLLAEYLLEQFGPHVAFGLPGLLMLIATSVFFAGRRRFIHIPPGGKQFIRETFSGDGLRAVAKMGIVFLFIAPFWALFDQTGSAWILQADKLDLHWAGMTWLQTQIQAVNPLLILILIPIFSFGVYPFANRFFRLTPLRKIAIGLFIAALSFVVSALIEAEIQGGDIQRATSTSVARGMGQNNLIDGSTDTAWASAKAPTLDAPQEILIRLRERKVWPISAIQIVAAGELTRNELVARLDADALNAYRDATKQPTNASTLRAKGATLGTIRQAVKESDDPLATAQKALEKAGLGTDWLDATRHQPKQIVVFAANWQDKLLPDSFATILDNLEALNKKLAEPNVAPKLKTSESSKQLIVDAADPIAYRQRVGWKRLGDVALDTGKTGDLSFETIDATHILIQIQSNQGGSTVRLSATRVFQSKQTPTGTPPAPTDLAAIGDRPSVAWQLLAYLILTIAEVLVSITCLEFAYTQAPARMKSLIMSLFLMSISFGNLFTAMVNHFIQKPDGTSQLAGASYYWFFVGVMVVTAVLFLFVVRFYKEKTYIHDDEPDSDDEMEEAMPAQE